MTPQRVKYVFVDVVRFTEHRHTAAQVAIVRMLNDAVTGASAGLGATFLPTGDGMCIVLARDSLAFDAHLVVARELLSLLAYAKNSEDKMLQFEVRIGVSENSDVAVTDINGESNFAGAGINQAQRAMAAAGPSQIFLTRSVYDIVHHHVSYWQKLTSRAVVDKHGHFQEFWQVCDPTWQGLNVEYDVGLTQFESAYLAAAVQFYPEIIQAHDVPESAEPYEAETLATTLYFIAIDRAHAGCADGGFDIGSEDYAFSNRMNACRFDAGSPRNELLSRVRRHTTKLRSYFKRHSPHEMPVIIASSGVARVYQDEGLVRRFGLPREPLPIFRA